MEYTAASAAKKPKQKISNDNIAKQNEYGVVEIGC